MEPNFMDNGYEESTALSYSFGLDLGTHRSLMAVKEKHGRVEAIIPEAQECRKGIPSLFWRTSDRDGGRELLCEEVALEDGEANDPEGVVRSVKARLAEKAIELHGVRYTPESIAVREVQHVLELSRDAAEDMGIFQQPERLTVGVPVRFGAAERGTIRGIVEKAAPGVKIQLLPEPMAAALYYASASRTHPRRILAFDMGAGTFDTCVLVANDQPTLEDPFPFKLLCHDGTREAGDRLDELMEDLILSKLRRNPGSIQMRYLEDPAHHDRRALRKLARVAKEALSSAPRYTVNISSLASGASQAVTVTREEYEKCIEPTIRWAVNLAVKCLESAGLRGERDMTLLLVGGSSYIPLVQRLLQQRFSWLDPKTQIVQRLPDQSVALGCALYSERPMAERKVAFAYAVDTFKAGTDVEVLDVRIPALCKLPYRIQSRYSTRRENQEGIRFNIYELEEGQAGDEFSPTQGKYTQLAARHSFGKPVPKGTSVLLTTELSADGILTMTIDDGGISSHRSTRCAFDLANELGRN